MTNIDQANIYSNHQMFTIRLISHAVIPRLEKVGLVAGTLSCWMSYRSTLSWEWKAETGRQRAAVRAGLTRALRQRVGQWPATLQTSGEEMSGPPLNRIPPSPPPPPSHQMHLSPSCSTRNRRRNIPVNKSRTLQQTYTYICFVKLFPKTNIWCS